MGDEHIEQLADALADRLAASDKLADAVAAKLNGQLSGIRKDMEEGFVKVEGRLGGVETDVMRLGVKIDGVASDLRALRRELVGVVDTKFPPIRLVKEEGEEA